MRSYTKPFVGKSHRDFSRKLSSKVRTIVLAQRVRLIPVPDSAKVELFVGETSHGIFVDQAAAMSHVADIKVMRAAPKREKARRWDLEYKVVAESGSSQVKLFVDGAFEGIFSNAEAAADYVSETFKPGRKASKEADAALW